MYTLVPAERGTFGYRQDTKTWYLISSWLVLENNIFGVSLADMHHLSEPNGHLKIVPFSRYTTKLPSDALVVR